MKYSRKYQEEAGAEGVAAGGGEGAGTNAPSANWRDVLPDDIKGNASLAQIMDIPALAKSFIETKSFQGNSIRIPGEDASEQAVAEFNDKIMARVPGVMLRPDMDNPDQNRDFYRMAGMPEKAEMYEAPEVELPEGISHDESKIEAFKEIAHKIGLSKTQYKEFLSTILSQDIEAETLRLTDQKESMAELQKEWGVTTEDKKAAALTIAEKTGAPEAILEGLKENTLPPDIVKWIHGISTSIGNEGNNLGDAPNNVNSRMTPAEAIEKMAEIRNNRDHPFYKGDKAAMDRMLELQGYATPDASRDINDLRKGLTI